MGDKIQSRGKEMKDYYVIKNTQGELLKSDNGSVLFFEYPIQADRYIDKHFAGSPFLKISKWRTKMKEFESFKESVDEFINEHLTCGCRDPDKEIIPQDQKTYGKKMKKLYDEIKSN